MSDLRNIGIESLVKGTSYLGCKGLCPHPRRSHNAGATDSTLGSHWAAEGQIGLNRFPASSLRRHM
jgi:hypothetical protein